MTPLGIEQAHVIQDMWKTESLHGLAPPHKLYCSPLSRALRTCEIMLDGVFQPNHAPVTIVEVSLLPMVNIYIDQIFLRTVEKHTECLPAISASQGRI